MVSIPKYLINLFTHRVFEFLEHWYIGSFRIVGEVLLGILSRLDKTFAVKVTIRHFFEPLYQDRTIIGYVFGIIFRTARLIIGASVYLFISIIVFGLYAIWLAIPVYFLARIFWNFKI